MTQNVELLFCKGGKKKKKKQFPNPLPAGTEKHNSWATVSRSASSIPGGGGEKKKSLKKKSQKPLQKTIAKDSNMVVEAGFSYNIV